MKTIEQKLKIISEEFDKEFSYSGDGIYFIEDTHTQADTQDIKDFYESQIRRILEEQHSEIQKEIDYCNRHPMKKWQKVRQEGYVQGLEFALRKCLAPTTEIKEVSGE